QTPGPPATSSPTTTPSTAAPAVSSSSRRCTVRNSVSIASVRTGGSLNMTGPVMGSSVPGSAGERADALAGQPQRREHRDRDARGADDDGRGDREHGERHGTEGDHRRPDVHDEHRAAVAVAEVEQDRKSTRLNSS